MFIVLNGELGCFYLLLSGIAVLHRVYNNLKKIPTLTLDEEEEECSNDDPGLIFTSVFELGILLHGH